MERVAVACEQKCQLFSESSTEVVSEPAVKDMWFLSQRSSRKNKKESRYDSRIEYIIVEVSVDKVEIFKMKQFMTTVVAWFIKCRNLFLVALL